MPFYDYKCLNCGTIKEVKKKISDPHPTFCEICSEDSLIRLHTAPAHVEYKGKGWFKTDGKY